MAARARRGDGDAAHLLVGHEAVAVVSQDLEQIVLRVVGHANEEGAETQRGREDGSQKKPGVARVRLCSPSACPVCLPLRLRASSA